MYNEMTDNNKNFNYPNPNIYRIYSHYMDCLHHLRGSRRELKSSCTELGGVKKIKGTLKYDGIFPFPFRYDIESNIAEGKPQHIVTLRVYLEDYQKKNVDIEKLNIRMKNAADFWTRHSPLPNLLFKFSIVSDPELAHFSVKFDPKSLTGVDYLRWRSEWFEDGDVTLEHEIGHMLGLEDEYSQYRMLTGILFKVTPIGADCDNFSSLMCNDGRNTNKPKPYHYQRILKRISKCD
jgi:hypothetical protein